MERKLIQLSDVITDIAAGPFGSNLKVSCFVNDGFPIIDGANLKSFKVTDNITKFVKNSDIAIGTLETNFIEGKYSGVKKYNSPIEFLTAVKQSGIDLVSLAHNHELDYGLSGLNETIAKVQDQEMSITGIPNNKENEK